MRFFLVGFIALVMVVFALMRSFERQDYYVVTQKNNTVVIDEKWLEKQRAQFHVNKNVPFTSDMFLYVSLIFIGVTSTLGAFIMFFTVIPYKILSLILRSVFRKLLQKIKHTLPSNNSAAQEPVQQVAVAESPDATMIKRY